MNIQRWIARREADWQRLETLLQQVEKKGLKSLLATEIRELASLYRSISADLARAKTQQVGPILIQNLQKLTSRSYTQIYQGKRHQEWREGIAFYRWGFPSLVRETLLYTLTAIAIFGSSFLISWWYSWQDPTFLSILLPEDLISLVRDEQQLWMGSIVGVEPLASSNIIVNNLSVSFSALGGGISFGVITTYILAINGFSIGAVAALVAQNHLAYPFWAFVLPHGALELPAIFLAGAGGLLIAKALLFPDKYNRRDALKYYGNKAAGLTFGLVPMLIIAGIVEGFFSPNPFIPDLFKYAVGLGILTLFLVYCGLLKFK